MSREGRYTIIEQEGWPRKEQFDLFRGFGNPYFALTANVDITAYRKHLPPHRRFTVGVVHALAKAANAVSPFRQRIRGEDVIEFDVVHPSIIVLNDEDAFRFCSFPFKASYRDFAADADERMDAARAASTMFTLADQDDYLFMTCIPWVSFTGVVHAAPTHAPDSVPRIAWGKAHEDEERVVLPLNVQVHHALVDGIHVGRFFAAVEEIFRDAGHWLVAD